MWLPSPPSETFKRRWASPGRAAVRRPSSSDSRRRRTVILVTKPVYWCVWWLVAAMHVTTAMFVLFVGFSHFALSLPEIHASTVVLRIPLTLERLTAASYLVVAAFHLRALARLVQHTVRAGRLTLDDDRFDLDGRRLSSTSTQPTRERTTRIQNIQACYHRAIAFWVDIFGPDGYLGINGPRFATFLVYRELLEIALQTYQLWSLSFNVSRAWINTFAVSAVVLNCFSISIVNLIFRQRETTRRLMHLVADMYLDVTCTMVVPVCVLVPYFLQFDWTINAYPLRLVVDDVWMTNALSEARHVLVTSYVDFVSSLFPHYSILSCLSLLKRLVRRPTQPKLSTHRSAIVPVLPSEPTDSKTLPRQGSVLSSALHEMIEGVKAESCHIRIIRAGIILWGVALLGLQVRLSVSSEWEKIVGCQAYVRPWSVSGIPCSVLYVNCHQRGIDGDAKEITDILASVERSVLTKLLLKHCRALTIPTTLVSFASLNELEIFNSTLVDWPAAAAIRQNTQPAMNTIYFGQSNITSIPRGILHEDLPSELIAIGFYNCTIESMPENIGDLWATTSIRRLSFESTQVRSVPSSIGRLPLRRLWLTGNHIEHLPDNMLLNSKLESIRLSGNPMKRLPNVICSTERLVEVIAEHTNISELPDWASEWLRMDAKKNIRATASMYGSPICQPSVGHLSERERSEVCTRDLGSRYGFVPQNLVQAKHAL